MLKYIVTYNFLWKLFKYEKRQTYTKVNDTMNFPVPTAPRFNNYQNFSNIISSIFSQFLLLLLFARVFFIQTLSYNFTHK